MNTEEARKINQDYARFDSDFRAAKKRGDFKAASIAKSKRDALASQFYEAVKVLNQVKS